MKFSKTPHFKLPFVADKMPIKEMTSTEEIFYAKSHNQKIYKRGHHKRQRNYNKHVVTEGQLNDL